MKAFYKHIVIAGSLLLLTRVVVAQDSSSFQSGRFRKAYDFFNKELVSQPLQPLAQYVRIEAGHSTTAGDYRQAQEAGRRNDLFFQTEGSKKIKQYEVSGFFHYLKRKEDSLAFTLRNDPENVAPYYMYASQPGNWDKTIYQLQGIVSREVGKHWHIGAGIDYNSEESWRSNDPRPEFYNNKMKVGLAVHYKLQKHRVGFSGFGIRETTENNVIYKNLDYSMSLAYPGYVTYMQYGYGAGERMGTRSVRSNTSGWGWKALYDGQFSFGKLTLKGGYRAIDSRYFLQGTGSEVIRNYGWFYEDIWDAGLLWNNQNSNRQWQLAVDYKNHIGRDFNQTLQGNNYVYSNEMIAVHPSYGKLKKGRLVYELIMDGSMQNTYRADGTNGIVAEFQYATVAANAAIYLYPATTQLLRIQLGGGTTLPIYAAATQPTQQTPFVKEVIGYDAVYFNASSWLVQSDLLYQFKVMKTTPVFIHAKGYYQQATIDADTYQPTRLPGNNRWCWQAGIGVTL